MPAHPEGSNRQRVSILIKDLTRLWRDVARLYGEDIAQDTMVRVLSREYRDYWHQKEFLTAKRQWQRQERRDSLFESYDLEEMGKVLYQDDTDRIHAIIELKRLCSKTRLHGRNVHTVVALVQHEMGLFTASRTNRETIQKLLRDGKVT